MDSTANIGITVLNILYLYDQPTGAHHVLFFFINTFQSVYIHSNEIHNVVALIKF